MASRRSRVLSALLLAAAATGGALAWQRWREARAGREIEAYQARLAAAGGDAAEEYKAGAALAERGDAAGLDRLEKAVELAPRELLYGSELRRWCVKLGQYDRAIAFFERLAAARADLPEPSLQLALAYVDKMPDHMMGIVGQGKLSKLSIERLAKLLEDESRIDDERTRWSALYALGMNHLYWPKALRHAPASVEAFERCVRFQKEMNVRGTPAYFVLAHVGLGDALVKDGRHEEARRVWREAAEIFPDDERLRRRLGIAADEGLTELVDEVRGLGIPIDTDLAILWGRKP
jgi:tetratricopeptide (TPR) repeat protein